MPNSIRAGLVFCLSMLIFIFTALQAGAETISVVIDPGEAEMLVEPDGRAHLKGPGMQRLNPVGAPNLPWKVVDVLLPPDADLSSVAVRLEGGRWGAVAGELTIAPAPPQMTWKDGKAVIDWPGGKALADGCDVSVYGRDAEYPAQPVRLVATGRMRQWRMAQVGVALFRWNPAQSRLQRLIYGELKINFSSRASRQAPRDRIRELRDPIAGAALRQTAVNFAAQSRAYTKALEELTATRDTGEDAELPLSGDTEKYVILTTSAIQSASTALSSFVTHKTSQGFTVQVVTESEWGGGTGNAAAENIRAWLQDHYISLGISHVLLIGNPDPSSGDVPMKLTLPKVGYPTPTDYYYADLTGNWDLDGNGDYAEFKEEDFGPGGVDRYWEVLVGRIPYYGDISDLDNILTRIIAYQNTPVEQTEWRKKVLLPMNDLGWNYPLSDYLGEDIRDDILTGIGWPSHRIYDGNTLGLDPPPETTDCTEENVVGVWSQPPYYGLVVWWAHGSPTSAEDVINTNPYWFNQLNDSYPSFTFQASCQNAWPENSGNLAYALLRKGGICTIGATRSAWSMSGHHIRGEPTIEGMAYEYTKRVTAMGVPAGWALNMLRQKIAVPEINDFQYDGLWMNYVDCNVYGDPDTTLYASSRPVHNITQDKRYTVIQYAVDDADEGDEIVLDPGTYTGIGNWDINFFGKNLTLRSMDPDDPDVVAATILDAGGASRIFKFNNGEDSSSLIAGLTLTGAAGHAIYCDEAGPTVSRCVFSNNTGYAIYLYPGDMIIQDCAFDANGGGIENSGGSPQITGCVFTANIADKGAGIYTSGGTPFISGCIFTGNTAEATDSGGGGLYGSTSKGELIIQDCLFSGNISNAKGGGLFIYENVHVINTIIVGNRAATNGGGIMCHLGKPLTLTNCTLANNRATTGGGICSHGTTTTMDNTILWHNTAATGAQITLIGHWYVEFFPTILTANACDLEGGTADVYIDPTSYPDHCTWNWIDGIIDDPALVNPGAWDDNGTPVDYSDDVWNMMGDYHLTPASPCIDTGDDTALHLPAFDYDGDLRTIDGDNDGTATVDMGADEYTEAIPCQGDLDEDGDVDGSDLALLAANPALLDLADFVLDFGKETCE